MKSGDGRTSQLKTLCSGRGLLLQSTVNCNSCSEGTLAMAKFAFLLPQSAVASEESTQILGDFQFDRSS